MAATDQHFCGRKNLKDTQKILYGDVQVSFLSITEMRNGRH